MTGTSSPTGWMVVVVVEVPAGVVVVVVEAPEGVVVLVVAPFTSVIWSRTTPSVPIICSTRLSPSTATRVKWCTNSQYAVKQHVPPEYSPVQPPPVVMYTVSASGPTTALPTRG